MALWLRNYQEVFSTRSNSDDAERNADESVASIKTAKSYLDSPLKFFLQTEGPDKDPTWLQAMPSEALRLVMKHCTEVAQGLYKPEIQGAIKQPQR